MSQIIIPFSREMAIAAMKGNKVATTRSERKGEVGDWFTLEDPENPGFSGDFNIIEIKKMDLLCLKLFWFRIEGFDSPEEFEKTWRALHRGHFTTTKTYFTHFFGRIA